MHRLFNNHDIVHLIVSQFKADSSVHSHTADLARLARVQRNLGELALDILWESVGLEALVHLFDEQVVHEDKTTGKVTFIRAPQQKHLTRFRVYAPRIKVLQRPYVDDHIDVKNVLEHLFRYTTTESDACIFPNLRVLRWFGASLVELPFLSLFFAPTFTSFLLTLDHSPQLNSPLMPAKFLEPPIASLARLSDISLREFWMPVSTTDVPLPAIIHSHCFELLARPSSIHLTQVSVVPSTSLLSALASLPSLRWLILNVRNWIPEPIPQIYEMYADLLHPFPSLETLIVHTPHLSQLISLFEDLPKHIYCHPCRVISIDTNNTPPSSDIRSVFSIFIPNSSSATSFSHAEFESFRLFTSGPSTIDPFLDYRLSLDDLQPILSMHGKIGSHVRHFELNVPGIRWELEDGDLHKIATTWPRLVALILGSERPPSVVGAPTTILGDIAAVPLFTEELGKEITLKGLTCLARLDRLKYLILPKITILDPSVEVWPCPVAAASSSLVSLSVGPTPLSTCLSQPIAHWLNDFFPKLKYVSCFRCNEDRREAWENVQKELKMI